MSIENKKTGAKESLKLGFFGELRQGTELTALEKKLGKTDPIRDFAQQAIKKMIAQAVEKQDQNSSLITELQTVVNDSSKTALDIVLAFINNDPGIYVDAVNEFRQHFFSNCFSSKKDQSALLRKIKLIATKSTLNFADLGIDESLNLCKLVPPQMDELILILDNAQADCRKNLEKLMETLGNKHLTIVDGTSIKTRAPIKTWQETSPKM